ncbi:MAG: DUF5009 domain-containing protein [Muribaculaceae bacterium]|nr:DUF5009 domain-containing protein [Muribaculaceae bacterium]
MTTKASDAGRLASLDVLRGFDLFLLVFFQPVLVAILRNVDSPLGDAVLYQFSHAEWVGFRFWDLVMPLFLFMTGVSMPFSFSKYAGSDGLRRAYRKIIKRVAVLFLFGMIVQGNLLALDPEHVYIYTNTLQAIAVGYLIGAMILLHCSLRRQIAVTLMLLVVYSVPIVLCGDYTLEGNFAYKVDQMILGRFRGDVSYTWVWSSLTFAVTVMSGVFAGSIMKSGGNARRRVVCRLIAMGLALVIAGWLWSLSMPILKRIWSCSMTLLSGGYCCLLMALFYYWIDYRGHIRGLGWLKIYGMNSITAYILGEVVDFRSIAHSLTFGLERYIGDFYPCWLTFANFVILFLILRMMYRRRIFLKI